MHTDTYTQSFTHMYYIILTQRTHNINHNGNTKHSGGAHNTSEK